MNWAGFICVGGPDENGQTRTFMYVLPSLRLAPHSPSSREPIGENRSGQSLLDFVMLANRWSPEEFEAMVNVWLEQSRTSRQRHLL